MTGEVSDLTVSFSILCCSSKDFALALEGHCLSRIGLSNEKDLNVYQSIL